MKKWSLWLIILTTTLLACKKDKIEVFQLDSQTFVTQASSSNNLGIQAGTLATERGVSEAVKAFAELIIADHTQNEADLNTLASAKGITVSNALIPVHQSNLNILNQFSDEVFDEAFAELMVLNMEETLNLYIIASTDAVDLDLRQFAANRIPLLRQNLQQARELGVAVTQ